MLLLITHRFHNFLIVAMQASDKNILDLEGTRGQFDLDCRR